MAAVILTNTYGNLADARVAVGLTSTDSSKDSVVAQKARVAARDIDTYCRRYFYVQTATQFYTATSPLELDLPDDLLTVTTLKTDNAWDRTYGTTWNSATDFDLFPYNARVNEPKQPFTSIVTVPNTKNFFVLVPKGVQIVGTFGFDNATEDIGVTLAGGGLTSSATSATVSDGSTYAAGDRLLIEAEQVLVTDVNANVLTIVRGYNGFAAASHASGVSILRYTVAEAIHNAWLRLLGKYYRLAGAPFGVSGASGSDFGTQQVSAPFDRELRVELDRFVKWIAG